MLNNEQQQVSGLSNVARIVANKDAATLAIVFHDNYLTGNTLETILQRSFNIAKNRITKIGPTSTDEQDEVNLAQKRDIIIMPLRKGSHTSYHSRNFNPPDNSSEVMVITMKGDNATIYSFYHDQGVFRLT